MTFTSPCFVRVENAEERENLISWCREIGYYFIETPPEHEYGEYLCCDDECVGIANRPDEFSDFEFIDCGTDEKLFKALAAMNDENDCEQWYMDTITHEMNFNHTFDRSFKVPTGWNGVRKATVEEIVEHFKNMH